MFLREWDEYASRYDRYAFSFEERRRGRGQGWASKQAGARTLGEGRRQHASGYCEIVLSGRKRVRSKQTHARDAHRLGRYAYRGKICHARIEGKVPERNLKRIGWTALPAVYIRYECLHTVRVFTYISRNADVIQSLKVDCWTNRPPTPSLHES